MLSDIEEVAQDLELSKQDVIRLSVAAGIKALKRMGYDGIASAVAESITDSDLTPDSPPPKSGKRGSK